MIGENELEMRRISTYTYLWVFWQVYRGWWLTRTWNTFSRTRILSSFVKDGRNLLLSSLSRTIHSGTQAGPTKEEQNLSTNGKMQMTSIKLRTMIPTTIKPIKAASLNMMTIMMMKMRWGWGLLSWLIHSKEERNYSNIHSNAHGIKTRLHDWEMRHRFSSERKKRALNHSHKNQTN